MRRHRAPRSGYVEEWCPDCQTRDALNPATGQPRVLHGMMLTGGCETCGGRGKRMVLLGKYARFVRRT